MEVRGVCLGDGEIACTDSCRSVDAGVGALSAIVLPLQEVVPIAVGSLEHAVEVPLGGSPILCLSCKEISSDAGDTHPSYIVVVFVVAAHALLIPGIFVSGNEVRVEVIEHGGILLVACRFEGIEDNLEHFGIAPPSAISDDPSRACLLVGAGLPFLHHVVALVLCEGFFHWLHNFYGPSDACRVEICCGRGVDDGQLGSVGHFACSGSQSVLPGGSLEDVVLVCSSFNGNEFP